MKRSDFRIIRIDKFDGDRTTLSAYVIQRRRWFLYCIPLWCHVNLVASEGYAENIISDELKAEEKRKKKTTTKTIVG